MCDRDIEDDSGQAEFYADQLKRLEDEENALVRVMNGTATQADAELLAMGCGIDVKKLQRRVA